MITWKEFSNLALEVFGKLSGDYPIKLVDSKYPFVRFENSIVRILVYCNTNGVGEIDVGLDPMSSPLGAKPLIRIQEFIGANPDLCWYPRSQRFATSINEARAGLEELCEDLRHYCHTVLLGDLSALNAVRR